MQKSKEIKKNFKPFQKKEIPPLLDPSRLFYTSLYAENSNNYLALEYMLIHGLFNDSFTEKELYNISVKVQKYQKEFRLANKEYLEHKYSDLDLQINDVKIKRRKSDIGDIKKKKSKKSSKIPKLENDDDKPLIKKHSRNKKVKLDTNSDDDFDDDKPLISDNKKHSRNKKVKLDTNSGDDFDDDKPLISDNKKHSRNKKVKLDTNSGDDFDDDKPLISDNKKHSRNKKVKLDTNSDDDSDDDKPLISIK